MKVKELTKIIKNLDPETMVRIYIGGIGTSDPEIEPHDKIPGGYSATINGTSYNSVDKVLTISHHQITADGTDYA